MCCCDGFPQFGEGVGRVDLSSFSFAIVFLVLFVVVCHCHWGRCDWWGR